MNSPSGVLFRGVDRAAFAAAFTQALRDVDLPVTTATMERFARALDADVPRTKADMYWLGRVCLVQDHRYYERYDQAFRAVFDDAELPVAPGRRDGAGAAPIVATGTTTMRSAPSDGFELARQRMATSAATKVVDDAPNEANQDHGTVLAEYLPADLQELADRTFDDLDDDQLRRIGGWLEERSWRWPTRASRRRQPGRSGRIDLRATLRAAIRTGGAPLRLCYRTPRRIPRRIVLIIDTSASMERYATVYLHLARALTRAATAEAFCFAATLTRVTATLSRREPQAVMVGLNSAVEDRFSGTRIATSLASLLTNRVWRELPRSAIVVIISDGWDADESVDLARQLGRIRRMAHRVIWVNPRAGDDRWEPALPSAQVLLAHSDTTIAGHTLRSVLELLDAVAS